MPNHYLYSQTAEIQERRARVATLYLQQKTQQEIAIALNVGQATISRDLTAIQESWQASALMDVDLAKKRELERIDELEREYWIAWEESKKDAEIAVQKAKGNVKEVSLQKKGQTGNPAYLSGVQWCIERRCKILGIDEPAKHEFTGKDGSPLAQPTVQIYLPEINRDDLEAD